MERGETIPLAFFTLAVKTWLPSVNVGDVAVNAPLASARSQVVGHCGEQIDRGPAHRIVDMHDSARDGLPGHDGRHILTGARRYHAQVGGSRQRAVVISAALSATRRIMTAACERVSVARGFSMPAEPWTMPR